MIFGYKVIDGRKCGFPDNALPKVLQKLEDYKISYQIIYKDREPVFKDFKKINKYIHFFKQSLYLIDKQNKIDMAIDKITNSSIIEIEKIMEAIYNVSHKQ